MPSRAAQILDAVEAALRDIDGTGGYLTAAGQQVRRGRAARSVTDGLPLPALVLRPGSETVLEAMPARVRVSFGMTVEALAAATDRFDAALADLVHDVRRALMRLTPGEPPLDGLAQQVRLESAEYTPLEDGSDIAVAEIALSVTYVDDLEG